MGDLTPGTRVRVTYEGVVDGERTRSRKSYQRVAVPGERGHFHAIYPTDTVEVLALPERRFEDGAYYLWPGNGIVRCYDAAADRFRMSPGQASWSTARSSVDADVQQSLIKLVPVLEGA